MTPDEPQPLRMSSEDQIGQLLRLAGRRRMPDPADMQRAREAAHAEWAIAVRQRARRLRWRSFIGGTLAAAACAAIVLLWTRPAPAPAPAVDIAAFQRITGTAAVTSAGSTRTVRDAGTVLRSGDRIEVHDDSRAAFAISPGLSVRMDRGTALVLEDAARLVLERGAVYVQSEQGASGSDLVVETTLGTVRHVGTRYEVRVNARSLRVRVREGSIALERAGGRWTGTAGEGLTLAAGGPVERHRIPTGGPEWAWIADVAEPFQLEGATLPAFLDWVGREEAWRWQIDDAALKARVDRIILHGSIDGLTPVEALEAVLPASGLAFRRDGDRLLVGPLPKP
jgi:ferric-dicitrate binding protein FerR (iron transport regulator)